RLRLTWSWTIRQDFGPIEHQIRIENLTSRELWIPMQDSFAFDLQIDPQVQLEHIYVEKGADKPSSIGTHEVSVADGYYWAGTATAYGDIDESKAGEVIPWTLIEQQDSENGWYLGMEFSGRTRISVERKGNRLHGTAGLDPDPKPFRTRLGPGESFESPVVLVGGFDGGPDGAGNILRKWVRATLGNPETWKNLNYPLVVNNSW